MFFFFFRAWRLWTRRQQRRRWLRPTRNTFPTRQSLLRWRRNNGLFVFCFLKPWVYVSDGICLIYKRLGHYSLPTHTPSSLICSLDFYVIDLWLLIKPFHKCLVFICMIYKNLPVCWVQKPSPSWSRATLTRGEHANSTQRPGSNGLQHRSSIPGGSGGIQTPGPCCDAAVLSPDPNMLVHIILTRYWIFELNSDTFLI